MKTNLDRYKADIEKLITLGDAMRLDLELCYRENQGKLDVETKKTAEKIIGTFQREYQRWYTEAYVVVQQLAPQRLPEFEQLYKGDGKRKEMNFDTYHIQDWLNGNRSQEHPLTSKKLFDDFGIIFMRFQTQLSILKAAQQRFDSSLHDIRQLVQADLFDSELDVARELTRNGFIRAAGAVAGVVLEKHLARVVANHKLTMRKSHPTISDLNDVIKNAAAIDIPAWRNIQRLADLRNLCCHNKHREPRREESEELVEGIDRIIKTIF